jgi:hypothetical protein
MFMIHQLKFYVVSPVGGYTMHQPLGTLCNITFLHQKYDALSSQKMRIQKVRHKKMAYTIAIMAFLTLSMVIVTMPMSNTVTEAIALTPTARCLTAILAIAGMGFVGTAASAFANSFAECTCLWGSHPPILKNSLRQFTFAQK